MRYLVILDPDSLAGRLYAHSADGFHDDGDGVMFPALDCIELETDRPYYIFAKRPLKEGASHQTLYLPHGSVAMIHRYAEDLPPSMGSPLNWPTNVTPIGSRRD